MLFSEMVNKAGSVITPINITADFEVNKLCYNSKLVEANDVFFAIKGLKSDGNLFIAEAVTRGAGAIITDSSNDWIIRQAPAHIIYNVDSARKTMAVFSNIFYGFPSQKMKLIGVTGTNGKTTVTSIIHYVLEFCGMKAGLIGTNKYLIAKRSIEASYTTPESVELNFLLSAMAQENVKFVSMEVSSHSLSLSRVYGLDFDTVVFMNLSPEHLDFHQDMSGYFKAKKILFDSMPQINAKGNATYAVFNKDDEYGSMIVKDIKSKTISFGFQDADYSASNVSMSFEGMSFDLISSDFSNRIDSLLTGRFNVYNILAAFASLRCLGIASADIVSAIRIFPPVEGRFNVFKLSNGAYSIIDYAHTPDSLYNALVTIKEVIAHEEATPRIITVFGCGGDRDKKKRSVMGEIAAKLSHTVIITSDNPRFEDPVAIINQIKSGIKTNNYSIEENRQAAITKAVEMSREGDIILIAGKGHESYQEIKGVRHHLSDIEIVKSFC